MLEIPRKIRPYIYTRFTRTIKKKNSKKVFKEHVRVLRGTTLYRQTVYHDCCSVHVTFIQTSNTHDSHCHFCKNKGRCQQCLMCRLAHPWLNPLSTSSCPFFIVQSYITGSRASQLATSTSSSSSSLASKDYDECFQIARNMLPLSRVRWHTHDIFSWLNHL